MPVAPAASCALGSGRTHTSNNEYPESPGVPARNGFNGFLRAVPGDRALLPPSPCGLKVLSSPVEPNEPPQDLTPASRRQDHTTSPSASSAVVLHAANRSRRAIRPALASHAQHCCVHRISSRVRDDRDTPLVWDETAAVIEVIWVGAEQQNFLLWDSTAAITPNLARRAGYFFTRRHSLSRRETKFDPTGKSPARPDATGVEIIQHLRRWGNGPRSALQASRACYGAIDGALRAACLEGGRSSLTLMV